MYIFFNDLTLTKLHNLTITTTQVRNERDPHEIGGFQQGGAVSGQGSRHPR